MLPFEQTQHSGVITSGLPDQVEMATQENRQVPEPSDEVCAALANLKRLGCVALGMSRGGGEHFVKVNPTRLGRDFVAA